MSGLRSTILAAIAAVSFASSARAADLFFPRVESAPINAQTAEFASGWYLRGDVGWTRTNVPKLNYDGSLLSTTDNRNAWTAGLGVGYQWNSWLRTDATLDYSDKMTMSHSTLLAPGGGAIVCPYALQGVSTQGANPVELGYLYDTTNTCRNDAAAKQTRLTFLLNGYIDLGNWYGVTPYVGGGIGATGTQIQGTSTYLKTSDGSVYNANLTPTGTYPNVWVDAAGNPVGTPHVGSDPSKPALTFAQQNWNTSIHQRFYRFAWSLTGGFAYDIAPHMKLDINYRYVNLGSYQVVDPNGAVQNKTASTQDVRVGLRWTPDL